MPVMEERYEPAPTAPRHARRFVARALRRWQCQPEVRDQADLLTSEIVSDALRQSPSQIAVQVEVDDDRVRVEVSDDPGVMRDPNKGEFERRTARRMLRNLAHRWGSDLDLGRTTTWFELRRGGRH